MRKIDSEIKKKWKQNKEKKQRKDWWKHQSTYAAAILLPNSALIEMPLLIPTWKLPSSISISVIIICAWTATYESTAAAGNLDLCFG